MVYNKLVHFYVYRHLYTYDEAFRFNSLREVSFKKISQNLSMMKDEGVENHSFFVFFRSNYYFLKILIFLFSYLHMLKYNRILIDLYKNILPPSILFSNNNNDNNNKRNIYIYIYTRKNSCG